VFKPSWAKPSAQALPTMPPPTTTTSTGRVCEGFLGFMDRGFE